MVAGSDLTQVAQHGPHSSYRAWATIVSAMLLCATISGGLVIAFGVLATSWIKAFDATHAQVMAIGVASTMGGGFFGIVVGKLAARYPSRPILGIGAVLAGIAFLFSAMADSIWVIFALFALAGGPAVALTGPVMGQFFAVRLFEKPGLALGIVSLGPQIGAALFPLLTALLLTRIDWRIAMVVIAIGMLALAALLILFGVVEPQKPSPLEVATQSKNEQVAARPSTLSIVRDPVFVGLVLVVLPNMCLSSAIYHNFTLFLVELGGTPPLAGTMLAVGSVVGIAASPLVGLLTDRTDQRILPAAGILLNVAAVLVCLIPGSLALLWFVMPLLSLAGAILHLVLPALLLRRFGSFDFSRAIGVAQPALYSSALGALFAAFVRDSVDTYQEAFAATLLLMLPAVFGYVLLLRSLRDRTPAIV